MKKIFIYTSLLIVWALFGVSCDNYLDEMPDNRAEVDSKEKVAKLLVSAYPGASPILLGEYSSDNVDDNGEIWNYALLDQQVYEWKDVTETSYDSPSYVWQKHYQAISSANMALDVIENVLGDTPDLAALKAEALISRAYSHFVLVNIFCHAYNESTSNSDLGIPYMLKPEKEVRPQYERGTVADVYERINADIEAAMPYLEDSGYSSPKYHFNRQAAYAFAARFNLYYNKPDLVIKYADLVLTSNPKRVLRNWVEIGASSNVLVVGYAYINSDSPANLLNLSSPSYWGRKGSTTEFNMGVVNGQRYSHNNLINNKETIYGPGPWGTGQGNFHFGAWSYQNRPKRFLIKISEFFEITDQVSQTGFAHIIHPMFTTDETLLCRAEAYTLKGEYEKASADIQTFFDNIAKVPGNFSVDNINTYYGNMAYSVPEAATPKKALNPVTYNIAAGTQENMIHCILHMRRILTLNEGLRWYDIKRHGIEISRRETTSTGAVFSKTTDKLTINDPRRAIQLPADVIDAGLAPNPR